MLGEGEEGESHKEGQKEEEGGGTSEKRQFNI